MLAPGASCLAHEPHNGACKAAIFFEVAGLLQDFFNCGLVSVLPHFHCAWIGLKTLPFIWFNIL